MTVCIAPKTPSIKTMATAAWPDRACLLRVTSGLGCTRCPHYEQQLDNSSSRGLVLKDDSLHGESNTPGELEKPDEIRDLAAFLFNLIENQITRADTKAGLILAADTVFVTTVSVLSRSAVLNAVDASAPFSSRLTAILTLLTFLSLACSTFFALLVARPKMPPPNAKGALFFFGNISSMKYADFVARFSAQSSVDVRTSLLAEVHITARLARRKFVRIRKSLDFLVIAVLLWTVIQAIAAMS